MYLADHFEITPGVRLPRSDNEWLLANTFFKSTFVNVVVNESSVNDIVKMMSTTIYKYFKETYGTVDSCDKDLENKYKDFLTKDLKRHLKFLKSSNAPIPDIKVVSSRFRKQLNRHEPVNHTSNITNHDRFISNHFWQYVKRCYMQSMQSLLPSFPVTCCTDYFCKTFSALKSNRIFAIPSWIPHFSEPTYPFDMNPPLYQTITSIIRRMKASTSPCPLGKISIICFKRCPYLRTFLTEIIRVIWLSGRVPPEWKKAATILIHKKGATNDPANFRPITLDSVPLKVFTSCIRNVIFNFLKQNNFIENQIQTGFTSNISGTVEHTSFMSHVINRARIKQRSLVITLLDLKNAFGEGHHNVLASVLSYHHIPSHVQP